MVHETLGPWPRALGRLHAEGPELVLADLVYTAARHLDHVHEQFTGAAQHAASILTRAAAGNTSINSLGVLQNSGTQVDILAARRDDAVDRLKEAIDAYRQVTASGDAASRARRPSAVPAPAPTITQPARVARGK
ncbi:hypothetical protein [Streptomyces anulatus]|uniref:hypothetical protein n=1 Tax=Streptomyces anulatus TaxID=1892 RepID=UPI0022501E99|nr:hypothetical protein [Streptomyces anulatus]MCX4501095.1 hypothetical protein [Streptomyces anulatus]